MLLSCTIMGKLTYLQCLNDTQLCSQSNRLYTPFGNDITKTPSKFVID